MATNQNKSVSYSRLLLYGLLVISYILYVNIFIESLEDGLTLYNGLFTIHTLSQSFSLFIFILTSVISVLNAFYTRKSYYYNKSPETINNELSEMINNKKENMEPKLGEIDNMIEKNIRNTVFLANKNHLQFTILEYSLIMLFVLSGAVFLVSVSDLVSLFLSIELQSYGLYIIATIYRNSESATGSGLTYFLLGGLSSCFILLGSAILYVNSGITNLDNIYVLNSINEFSIYNDSLYYDNGALNYINFSLIILTVGLLFKISAAPFHFWSPDVYDGIPTIVTTFVAIIAKISLLVLMLNLVIYSDINSNSMYQETEVLQSSYMAINSTSSNWKNILVLSSLMSLVIGSILGLTQYRIKRLFAYSTISHVGFILLALSINKIESIQAYIFYILQYSVSNLNAFFILITIGYTLYRYKYTPNRDKQTNFASKEKYIDVENSPIQLLSQIKGYFYINAFLSISFAITLFSFVGIPPLIGFFAKQMILSSALDEGYIFMTLVAIITSVIGAAYYLNIIKLVFFSKSDYVAPLASIEGDTNMDNIFINDKLSVIISILTMFILLFIFMPDEWFRIVNIISLSINKS